MPKLVNQDKVNRIYLLPEVNRAVNYYMHDKKEIISGVPGATMNKQGVVNQLLMLILSDNTKGMSYYPPKDEVAPEPES